MLNVTWFDESNRIVRVVETTHSWNGTSVREILYDLNKSLTKHDGEPWQKTEAGMTAWVNKHYLPKVMNKAPQLLVQVEPTYLSITHGISKARDTYGYNRVQVQDTETGKRFSACGGGYDMLGSAFGEWLQKTHQSLLLAYSDLAHDICEQYDQGKPWARQTNRQGLYGMTLNTRQGVKDVSLDGGCGLDCMIRIARAIGLTVDPVKTYNRRGQCSGIVGYHITGGVK